MSRDAPTRTRLLAAICWLVAGMVLALLMSPPQKSAMTAQEKREMLKRIKAMEAEVDQWREILDEMKEMSDE